MSGAFLAAALLVLFGSAGCDDARHRAILDSLVRDQGIEKDVLERLGGDATIYQRGTPSWVELEKFLARESPSAFRPVRRAVERYPRILLYTTAWRMTWIFLDDRGVVRDFSVGAQ